MAIFGTFASKSPQPPAGPPEDPKWSRSASGLFRRFAKVDPEAEGLTDKGGVFVIWHGGLRPQWVYAGYSKDLAAALHDVADDDDIMHFEVNGGLFVSWAFIKEEFRGGVVRYLNEAMDPLVANPAAAGLEDTPIPVIFPGKGAKK
ncbi:MAG: hypothetical protein RBS99_12280 [Rhodospirillales bacterium]|jgi:hypothetical protein|nr:hypothetical protein [Rhodospirillales bacterium]